MSRKLRYKAIRYVLLDDQLYYRSVDGELLRCLSLEEAVDVMDEVHGGLCGAHQSAHVMRHCNTPGVKTVTRVLFNPAECFCDPPELLKP